jgi:transcriptional regulator with PAS, ATPase and Fis domain
VALTEDPVLIQGESGVGKELVARLIHESSRLKDRQFLAINCGALPEDLLVSELFGYEKGAFTGADSTKAGLFEATGGGTLFLDEIGDLPLSMQARFLRVLEQKEVIRVGGRSPVPVEFRLVAATNRDLEQMAGATPSTFRADLYYRLRVHLVTIPPLRERPADIPLLLDHFIRVLEREGQTPVRGFSAESLEVLIRYGWPGNIRELASLVRQVGVVASGRTVEVDDLPSPSRSRESIPPVYPGNSSPATRPAADGPESLDQLKLDHIRQVLERTEGNRTQAARLLGMSRVTLQRFLARHPELSRVGKGEPDPSSG